jgi:hypothetical protein
MKKSIACVIFYSWTGSENDTRKIDKIRRFVRRERLSVDGDKYECNSYTMALPDTLHQIAEPLSGNSEIPCGYQHMYFVWFSCADQIKLHKTVG